MSELQPGDGLQIEVTYSTAIFKVGFTLPEGIQSLSVDRMHYSEKPDDYMLMIHVEAPSPEEAQQRVRALRQTIVDVIGRGLETS